MKIKMEFTQLSMDEVEVVKKRDALLAAIERLKRSDRVQRDAQGAVRIGPGQMDVISGSLSDAK